VSSVNVPAAHLVWDEHVDKLEVEVLNCPVLEASAYPFFRLAACLSVMNLMAAASSPQRFRVVCPFDPIFPYWVWTWPVILRLPLLTTQPIRQNFCPGTSKLNTDDDMQAVHVGCFEVDPAVAVNLPAGHLVCDEHESVDVDELEAEALYCPVLQAVHTGGFVVVPPVAVYFPATHRVSDEHESVDVDELEVEGLNRPWLHGVHTGCFEVVPAVDVYFPA